MPAQPEPQKPPLLKSITIVVNGKPTTHDYPANQPLRAASERALNETNNKGPLDQWVLTYAGRTLDFNKTLAEENIPSNATLHLNPRKGAGGHADGPR